MTLNFTPTSDQPVSVEPIDLAAFDQANGRFLRLALAKKHEPSQAIAILSVLQTNPEWGTPEYERKDKLAHQLTRNVLAMPVPAKVDAEAVADAAAAA